MTRRGVAIVTGAGHGIGLAVARRLGDRGLAVAAVDVDGAALTAAPLPSGVDRLSQTWLPIPQGWLGGVVERLGTPTVLVNNAAYMEGQPFLELPMDAVRRSLDVTLFGSWALTRAGADLMMIGAGEPGAVVFNLSLQAQRVRMLPDYSVGKAALWAGLRHGRGSGRRGSHAQDRQWSEPAIVGHPRPILRKHLDMHLAASNAGEVMR